MARVSVLTLNVLRNRERWTERAPMVVDGLFALRPDIVALQECFVPGRQARWIAEQLNDRLPEPGYRVSEARKTGLQAFVEAVAVLTRLPVLEEERIDLQGGNRVAQRVRIALSDGTRLDCVNTHLHHPPEETGLRAQQARTILDWLAGLSGAEAMVLAGDFNATPHEEAVRLVLTAFRSVFAVLGQPDPVTYASRLIEIPGMPVPQKTVDYIFVSPNLRVASARRVFDRSHRDYPRLYASDHFGLYAELELE